MGKVIAYVEDDQDMIDLVAMVLERFGYQVNGFAQPEGVLEKMVSLSPDLIILDLMMPRMDGFEVYRRIKKRDELKEVPVVVITAMKKAVEQIEKEERMEVQGCLLKPFSINELVEMVKRTLSRERG